MVDKQDEIDKAVNIIIATKGTKEATKEVETMHDKSHKGQEQLQRDAKKSAEANDLFTRKWKNELLMIGGALGALYGLTKYSPVAASMIDILGVSLGYLATVILLPMLPYMLQLVGYVFDLADAFTKLDPTVQTIISALTSLALGWAVLKNLPGFDLAKKIVFGAADLLKTAAGLGTMSAATFWAAFAAGILLGLAVVVLMIKTGFLDKLVQLGQEFKAKFPGLFDFLTVVLAPLGMLGAAINDVAGAIIKLSSGDAAGAMQLLKQIPSDILKVWTSVKDILGKWGVPTGLTDLAAALTTLASAILLFKGLTKPIELIKTVAGIGGKALSAITGVGGKALSAITGVGGKAATTAAAGASNTLPSAAVNSVASTGGSAVGDAAAHASRVASLSPISSTGAASAATSAASTAATAATGAATAAAATGGIINTVGSVLGKVAGLGSKLLPGLNVIAGLQMIGAMENGATTAESTPIPLDQYAAGGYVSRDGLAQLHKGDWIRSKYGDTTRDSTGKTDKGSTGNTFNGPINIVTQSSNPREIYRYLNQELGKAARSRV